MKKKLKLTSPKVQSFVTSVKPADMETVKGGISNGATCPNENYCNLNSRFACVTVIDCNSFAATLCCPTQDLGCGNETNFREICAYR